MIKARFYKSFLLIINENIPKNWKREKLYRKISMKCEICGIEKAHYELLLKSGETMKVCVYCLEDLSREYLTVEIKELIQDG